MKNRKVITRGIALSVSLVGIVLLVVLQYVWLKNAYEISEQNLKDKCMVCIEEAISKSFFDVSKNDPKGEYSYRSQNVNNDKQIIVALMDIYTICKGHFNIEKIDSTLSKMLRKELGYLPKYNIYLTNRTVYSHSVYGCYYKDNTIKVKDVDEKYIDKVLDSTYTYFKRPINKSISRILLTTQLNTCQDINLELINPQYSILNQAKYMLLTSIIIIILIASILLFLLRSALRENRFVKFIKEYTHALTHDLRSPLNSINLASTILYDECSPLVDKKSKDYLRICKDQSRNMLDSIDRILTVAKTEQTDLVVNKSNVMLKPYLQEITRKFIDDNIHVKPIVVDVFCDQDDLKVAMDTVLMSNVLNNLMDNAVKYSYESVKIAVRAFEKGNAVHISIKDDGMGIPANDLEAIFEHFNQGSLLERKRMFGYGIGLSFIKHVVQAHGGHVKVSSKEMEGSEFTIVLPE